jgi:2-polyprenyl-3-methyl-5-hydroxy-6-metoxy-1,4-benzoquinol methylase
MSSADERPQPIYHVPFAWDSSHGHVVELLVEHAEPGLIVDVGCGYAPHAERLVQRGFEFAGIDVDDAAVEDLAGRGFATEVADADDVDALLTALDRVVEQAGGPVSAVLALDVLEHLRTPHSTLAGLAEWMTRRGVSLLGVSLPNLSHGDVAVKLMAAHFDMTPSGLLDHTHLRFFTSESATAMCASAGFSEVARHDVEAPTSDQDWPEIHPLLSHGSLSGSLLRRVRSLSDDHGGTFQFVRLFAPDPANDVEPTLLAVRPVSPVRGITALIDHSCSDADHAALVAQLVGQDDGAVAHVRLEAEDDLSAVVAELETTYVSILRGGERLESSWARELMAVADRYPAAVVRTGPTPDAGDGIDGTWPARFSLFDHYLGDHTPSAALAIPTAFLRDVSEVWKRGDAAIDTHALLLEASELCGVVETAAGTVAVRPGWSADSEHVATNIDVHSQTPTVMPPGAPSAVAAIIADQRERVAQLEAHIAGLEEDSAWLNAELARRPVRAVRKALSFVDRLRRS